MKYRNVKTTVYHIGKPKKFDSKAEAARYIYLTGLVDKGEITQLKCQERFTLAQGFRHKKRSFAAITYITDFTYKQAGEWVAEDVKGVRTGVYMLKRKMFIRKHGRKYIFKEVYYRRNDFIEKIY